MRFPVPGVAGVFLSLSGRLKTAVTDGSAAHYLLGRTPTRLRNHLGFHAALAEMSDALLERAVLPCQTTSSLPSLAVLPTARFSGTGALRSFVGLPEALSNPSYRRQLGSERRFAPLEFWQAVIRGSGDLAQRADPLPVDAPTVQDANVAVYPPCLAPMQWEDPVLSWWEYGFQDMRGVAWDPAPSYRCPGSLEGEVPDCPAAYDVPDMLYRPGGEDLFFHGRSLAMLLHLPFDCGSPDADSELWYPDPSFFNRLFPFLFYLTGGYSSPEVPDGDSWGASFLYGASRSTGEPEPVRAHLSESALGFWDYTPGPRGGPLKLTCRPDLDLLRIYQILLGSMWANWARLRLRAEVPHVMETVVRTWTAGSDGVWGEPVDTRPSDGNKTCAEYYEVQRARWSLSCTPDSEFDHTYGCEVAFRFNVPVGRHSNEGGESEGVVEDYPFLDPLALTPEEATAMTDRVRAAEAAVSEARQAKADAESDMEAANQVLDSAATFTSFYNAMDRSGIEDALNNPDPSYCWADPDQNKYICRIGGSGHSWSGDYDDPDQPKWRDELRFHDLCSYWTLDEDTWGKGLFLFQDTARSFYDVLRGTFPAIDVPQDIVHMQWSMKDAQGRPYSFDIPDDIVQALQKLSSAQSRLAEAEAVLQEDGPIAEHGVPVEVGDRILDCILSQHLEPASWSSWNCDTYSRDVASQIAGRLFAGQGLDGWTPYDPQGGGTFSIRAVRIAPVLGGETCPPRLYLAGSSEEGVSCWPAASLIDGGYVGGESVAVGFRMMDETNAPQGDSDGYFTGYYFPGEDSEDAGDYPPKRMYRKLGYDGAESAQVSVEEPAARVREMLRQIGSGDLPDRASTALVYCSSFSRLLFVRPQLTHDSPTYEWGMQAVYAWYHPDRGPARHGDSPYRWLGEGLYPYTLTHGSHAGAPYEPLCDLEAGDYTLPGFAAHVDYVWQALSAKATGFSDEMTLHISDHLAVRAEWNWKSMPVEHT